MNMKILLTICGRGGSKGIPGKNFKELNGKPLIAYTIETACKFASVVSEVTIELSTDSQDILVAAATAGLSTDYRRADCLATDTAGKIDVIKDLLLYSERVYSTRYDYILDMDITSPMRNVDDLKSALEIIDSDEGAVNIFSVSPASRNPYFNMVEQKETGYYGVVVGQKGEIFSRQKTPAVYDMNASFYFYKRSFFDMGYRSAITDKSLIYITPHICFDLDHSIDFEFMEYLIKNGKLDFEM